MPQWMNIPKRASLNHAIRSDDALSSASAGADSVTSITNITGTTLLAALILIARLSLRDVNDRIGRGMIDLDPLVLHQPNHLRAGEQGRAVAVNVIAGRTVIVVDVVVGIIGADAHA